MSGADLVARGLGKRWGGRAVLTQVDLCVPAGRAAVLLGSSGAGKTTLLRILAGLETADEGRVELGGRVLSDPALRVAPEARSIGVVFQALELWPHMTVAEHIAFGLPGRPRGHAALRHAAVRDLADEVGLADEMLARLPATLSGGEQQRVAIARTLAPAPDVILYDEPLANLDPDRRRSLRALIRRLARRHGTTLVYVTHDPEEALEIGDEVTVLSQGRVVERGVPAEVYAHPTTFEGAAALGPVTRLPGISDGARVRTALGDVAAAAPTGACVVLWRPEAVGLASSGGVEAVVLDTVARGSDWGFTARVGEAVVEGRSAAALEAGSTVRVRAGPPAAILPLAARSALQEASA